MRHRDEETYKKRELARRRYGCGGVSGGETGDVGIG